MIRVLRRTSSAALARGLAGLGLIGMLLSAFGIMWLFSVLGLPTTIGFFAGFVLVISLDRCAVRMADELTDRCR